MFNYPTTTSNVKKKKESLLLKDSTIFNHIILKHPLI